MSEQVAKEMLDGILNLSKSDYAISVTGIAGPSGGTQNKPVGLVYIGMAPALILKLLNIFSPVQETI